MRATPGSLVWTTAGSSLLTVVGFASVNVRRGEPWPVLLLGFLCVLGGIAGLFLAPQRLRLGVQEERWPEETLRPYRRVMEHPLWTGFLFVLLAVMVYELLQFRHHGNGAYWAAFCVMQASSQLSSALRKPSKPSRTFGLPMTDWSKVKPITSEHWGER